MRVAIVEDDADFMAFVSNLLTGDGHNVVTSNNGNSFLRLVKNETFDLILLDWNLPGTNGIGILKVLREEMHSDVPVILLTLRGESTDIVAGLHAGADDFVVKPVDGDVLLARIEAIARRRSTGWSAEPVQTFGNYMFDSAQEAVHHNGETTVLTSKEFQLALMLFRNMSRPLSRAYLLEAVWNRNPEVQTRTLDSHVARLRSKLGLRPENGFRLAPIYSYGYRLEAVDGAVDPVQNVA